MLTLTAVVQTQRCWTLRLPKSAVVRKTLKKPANLFWLMVNWDNRGVEDIRRPCIHHFAWWFVHKKAVFKVGAAFAHSRSKTTCRWSRALLLVFQSNKKEFLYEHMTMDETLIHHFSLESNQQLAEGTATGESCPNRPKMQTQQARFWPPYFRMLKVFCSSITLKKEELSIANII